MREIKLQWERYSLETKDITLNQILWRCRGVLAHTSYSTDLRKPPLLATDPVFIDNENNPQKIYNSLKHKIILQIQSVKMNRKKYFFQFGLGLHVCCPPTIPTMNIKSQCLVENRMRCFFNQL